MAKKLKRTLSLVIALAMTLTMMPVGVFAAGGDGEQIVSAGGSDSLENGAVTMSKTVSTVTENGQTVENKFDVTLQVVTTQALEEITVSKDAAVVLVMDVSNSMEDDIDGKTTNTSAKKRITLAKAAAAKFVDDFAADAGDAKRMISVVEFGSNAKTVLNWNNVATDNGVAAKSAIGNVSVKFSYRDCNIAGTHTHDESFIESVPDGEWVRVGLMSWDWKCNICGKTTDDQHSHEQCTFEGCTTPADTNHTHPVAYSGPHGGESKTDNGGTNIEAGLMLADNLLAAGQATGGSVAGIESVYVILLTDGVPTYHVDNTSTDTTFIEGSRGGGDSATKDDYKDVPTEASQIKTKGATLYSINYGNSTNKVNKKTIENWLINDVKVNQNFSAADAGKLSESFKSITTIIGLAAQAWQVSDPMGDRILFDTAANTTISSSNADYVRYFNTASKTLEWNLLNETPVEGSANGKTTYTYALTYRVALDNVGSGFVSGQAYAVNGNATLKYLVLKNGEKLENMTVDQVKAALKTASFKVPTVRGWQNALTFTKTGLNGALLEGAKFTLTDGSSTFNATSDNTGEVSFTGIPSGRTYTLTETDAPAGYLESSTQYAVKVAFGTLTVNNAAPADFTVANDLDAKNTSLKVTKSWSDNVAHSAITVTLWQSIGGAEATASSYTATLSDENGWSHTFPGIPTVDVTSGNTITYTVKEGAVSGYKPTYGGNMTDGLTIHNVITDDLTVSIDKAWVVPTGFVKPASIEVALYRASTNVAKTLVNTITLTAEGGWSWSDATLDKYDASGAEYTYSVEELYDNDALTSAVTNTGTAFTVTNTIKNSTVSLTVNKVWKDAALAASRPTDVTVNVLKNGVQYGSVTLNSGNNWSATVNDLPVYDINGDTVTTNTYTVAEDIALGAPYTVSYSADTDTGANYAYTVTNSLTGTVTINGEKTWIDPDDTTRPNSITVSLYRKGTQKAIASITLPKLVANEEYDAEAAAAATEENPYMIPQYVPGPTTYDFGSQPKYDADGNEYSYFVRENDVTNYTPKYEGYNISNTLNASEQEIIVTKNWVDNSNAYTTRPATLTIYLTDNNGEVYTETITDARGGDSQQVTFDVPVNKDGARLTYTISEGTEAANYDVSIDQNARTITNTLKAGTTSVAVEKDWVDAGTHPEVTVQLYKNNTPVEGKTLTLNTENEWNGIFENLPKYENGVEIAYTVDEPTVPTGYTKNVTGSMTTGFTVTNTLTNPNTSVNVSKLWIDGSNAQSTRPGSVTVRLYADGTAISGEGTDRDDLTLSANTEAALNWKGSFTDLPVYDAEYKVINYTVDETTVPTGYAKGVTGSAADGFTITNTLAQDTISIPVSKNWVGPADARPENVTVQLYAGGVAVAGKTLTLSASETAALNWKGSFENLEKYDANRNVITYTVKELNAENVAVENNGTFTCGGETYTATYTGAYGATITNTIVQDNTVSIPVEKLWENMDAHGYGVQADYPASITVQLYADGNIVDGKTLTLTANDDATLNWKGAFTGLPEFALGTGEDGHRIAYTVKEVGENNNSVTYEGDAFTVTYGTNANGLTITNTFVTPSAYYYRIIRNYTTRYSDGTESVVSQETGAVQTGVKDETVTAVPGGYAEHDGWTYDYVESTSTPSQTLIEANNVYVITLNYERAEYILNIRYEFTDNQKPATGFENFTDSVEGKNVHYAPGEAYDVTGALKDAPAGYDYVGLKTGSDAASGSFGDADVTVTFVYSPESREPTGPVRNYYRVTVNYFRAGTTDEVQASYTSARRVEGSAYDVTAQIPARIGELVLVSQTGDTATGTLTSNKTINVYYDEYTEPGDPDPDPDPVEPPIEIDPERPPLGPEPDLPDEGDDIVIVPDDIPLGDLPNTGVTAQPVDPVITLGLLALTLSLVAAGIGVLGRKKEQEEE